MGKFALVGASNAVIDFSVFYLLYGVFEVHYVFAHISGFLCALINGFYWNATWTFQNLDKARWYRQAARYGGVGLVGLGLSTLMIVIANYMTWVYFAKFLAVFTSFSWNYCASSLFVFKEKNSSCVWRKNKD